MVRAPLEPAHFLSVSLQAALRLEGRGSGVALQDHPIATPRRQLVGIPRQRTWRRGRHGRAGLRFAAGRRASGVSLPGSVSPVSTLTHSSRVAFKHRELLSCCCIPYLNVAFMSPHGHQVSLTTKSTLSITQRRMKSLQGLKPAIEWKPGFIYPESLCLQTLQKTFLEDFNK